MQKLDSKKLKASLGQLKSAATSALKTLNAQTDNGFAGIDEKDPLKYVVLIVRALEKGIAQAEEQAKYEGMDDEQIAQAQADEREQAKADLLEQYRLKLQKRYAAKEPEAPEVDETAEPEGDAEPEQEQPEA